MDGVASEKKAVLWIHGLGDTGESWKGAFNVKGVEWHHPTAPTRPVSCNGMSQTTSWFDIKRIPVDVKEPEEPKDFDATVASVHSMLEGIEKSGVPASNILLGGFSQGGATSLQAGLSYSKRLAGVISISGWCPNRSDVSAWISEAGKETPVLMCCGDGDPVVDISVTKLSAVRLGEALGANLEAMYPKRPMHQPDEEEMDAVERFMKVNLRGESKPEREKSKGTAFEGLVSGKYKWDSNAASNRDADADNQTATITKYAWDDSRKAVNIHVELDGLDDVADDEIVVQSSETSASLSIASVGKPPKKRELCLKGLSEEITGVKLVRKPGKNKVVLKLLKKDEKSWTTLLNADSATSASG